jgi:hypothetical protein
LFPSEYVVGQPPPFAIADVFDDPSVGGDEIAIGMLGTSTIQVYTASAASLNPITNSPELPYHLTFDTSISLPGPLVMPPIFADVDGDGLLDVIATVNANGEPFEMFDALNTGSGFSAPTADTLLNDNQCLPQAAAKLFGSGPSELSCGGRVPGYQPRWHPGHRDGRALRAGGPHRLDRQPERSVLDHHRADRRPGQEPARR